MVNLSGQGNLGENIACEYLKKKGYVLIMRNFRSKFGEIDIICKEKQEIVFVEVKLRKSKKYGLPQESIGKTKLSKIIKTIEWFFINYPKTSSYKHRIDAVAILLNNSGIQIKHFKNIS